MDWHAALPLAGIIWIDLLLSGDNAIVIALVCRTLPPKQQRIGIALGSLAAVIMRVAMAAGATALMAVEGLQAAGGLFLLFVAAKLVWDDSDVEADRKPATSLWAAVGAIALADASMSLDNVMAIAALAKGNMVLMAAGIALSIPLVIIGAAIIKSIVDRLPWIVWLGAGLLGWVAGSIIISDPLFVAFVSQMPRFSIETDIAAAVVGACAVLAVGAVHRITKAD